MLVRAAGLAQEVLRARVCIVGAGPAGLTLARSLAGCGLDLLVLEAADPDLRPELLETVTSTGIRYAVAAKRGRGVGGGGLTWNLETPVGRPHLRLRELDELDLLPRPGVRDVGWPLSVHDLEGPYRDAWALFGMPGFARGAAGRGSDRALDEVAEQRLFGLGPAATFTTVLPGLLAEDSAVRIVTGAVVTELRTDGDAGSVTSVRFATAAGAHHSVEADVYVLAGGGIENARLLLASTSRHGRGVGNAHDHVGRYFMEHPHFDAALVRPSDARLEDHRATWDVHAREGMAVQHLYALTQRVTERSRLLSTAWYLVRRGASGSVLPSRDGGVDVRGTVALRGWQDAVRRRRLPPRPWAAAGDLLGSLPGAGRHLASSALAARSAQGRDPRRAARVMTVRAMAEQVPNPLSRVCLSGDRDAFGVPTAQLDWRLTALDWSSMTRSIALALPALRTLLGGRVDSLLEVDPEPWVVGGSHQMGTTRMAASPRDGVVDEDGRVHGMANLYVAGSSVFPTGGSSNPTLTVVALALRLGTHLRSRFAAPLAGPPPLRSTPTAT